MSITLQDISSRLDVLTAAVLSNKNVLNIDEAAAFTGMTVSYLYKLTSTQEIPHYKPRGKMLYFDRAEFEGWLLQRRVKSTDEIEQAAADHVSGVVVAKSQRVGGCLMITPFSSLIEKLLNELELLTDHEDFETLFAYDHFEAPSGFDDAVVTAVVGFNNSLPCAFNALKESFEKDSLSFVRQNHLNVLSFLNNALMEYCVIAIESGFKPYYSNLHGQLPCRYKSIDTFFHAFYRCGRTSKTIETLRGLI